MALPGPLTNILFPTRSCEGSLLNLSMITTRARVLDACYSVYRESTFKLSADVVDSFYETNASKFSGYLDRFGNCSSLYSSVSSYPPYLHDVHVQPPLQEQRQPLPTRIFRSFTMAHLFYRSVHSTMPRNAAICLDKVIGSRPYMNQDSPPAARFNWRLRAPSRFKKALS